jgi:hypothetical protein
MPSRIAAKTYGTVSPDRQKEMTGLEFVQGLVDGTLPLNTIAQTLCKRRSKNPSLKRPVSPVAPE